MTQEVVEIELDQIIPSPTNPRKYFNEPKLKELAASIKQTKGVIQAVTVRPHPQQKHKFELVCGERRYRASGIAEMPTISSVVKNLTDEEVMELQFIENIEREDVHPMDEAVTFKAMVENKLKPWALEDIAAKINKPATYVAQRIQLNNLIPSLQKEFWDGKFLVGHAVLFARLMEQDQREVVKNYNVFNSQIKAYSPVKNVNDFIIRNIMRKLSMAPFKKDDADLVPAVGACFGCGSRTGGNSVLFPDLKNDDRCLDGKCFANKSLVFLLNEMQKVLTTHPDVFLLQDYGGVPTAVAKLAEKYKVHIMVIGTSHVSVHKQSGYTPIKVFWVNGENVGKITTAYRQLTGNKKVEAKKAAGEEITAKDIDEQISGIRQRMQRGKELDFEKSQEAIVKNIEEKYPDDLLQSEMPKEERDLFLLYFLYEDLAWSSGLDEVLGVAETKDEDYDETPNLLFSRLKQITQVQYDSLVMRLIMTKYQGKRSKGPDTEIVRRMARAIGVDVNAIVTVQDDIRLKREANAEKRIADLEEQKAALKPKKEKSSKALKKGIAQLLSKQDPAAV